MEKLRIEGFAGMEDVELDIGRFNVFIGPQAAGKSVCAKLLYFFKGYISEILWLRRLLHIGSDELAQRNENRLKRFFPPACWGDQAFQVTYTIGNASIQLASSAGSRQFSLAHSENITTAIEHAQEHRNRIQRDALEAEKNDDEFVEILKELIGPGAARRQHFIPAGRSFFATVQSSAFTLLDDPELAMDPFFLEFGKLYERVKSRGESGALEVPEAVSNLIHRILCGTYIRKSGKDFLALPDGRTVPVMYASSGQQEMLPLSLILCQMLASDTSLNGDSLYIEEPEAHLFPPAQRAVVELIATVFNLANSELQFVITTHSPYILTAFDNLLKAGQVEQSMNGDARQSLYDIVPKEQILHAKDFRGYLLEGGHAQNLMEAETGLLVADAIDDVSDALMAQFEQLMDLEES